MKAEFTPKHEPKRSETPRIPEAPAVSHPGTSLDRFAASVSPRIQRQGVEKQFPDLRLQNSLNQLPAGASEIPVPRAAADSSANSTNETNQQPPERRATQEPNIPSGQQRTTGEITGSATDNPQAATVVFIKQPEGKEITPEALTDDTHGDNQSEIQQRRYASGERRLALQTLASHLPEAVDPTSVLHTKATTARRALPMLLDPELSNKQISDILGITPNEVSKLCRIITEAMLRQYPNELTPHLPQPTIERRTISPESFGGQIKELRDATGLTQRELAESLGWSISKVLRIETNDSTLSVTDTRALLDSLGVDRSNTRYEEIVQYARTLYANKRLKRKHPTE